MSSDEASSCSDCKIEMIESVWTQLLLNWINKCVNTKTKAKQLSARNLLQIVNKYKGDICCDDLDRAMLCTDDVEPFIQYKYPIFRLRYILEEKDILKRIYMMTSILLYHCCVSSQTGEVERDIYNNLSKEEQEIILKFCENVSEMEVTVNNVDRAIGKACEEVTKFDYRSHKQHKIEQSRPTKIEDLCNVSSFSIDYEHLSTKLGKELKKQNLQFKSSVTVMPSVYTEPTSYSKYSLERTSPDPSDSSQSLKNETIDDYKDIWEGADMTVFKVEEGGKMEELDKKDSSKDDEANSPCQPDCDCTRCSATGPCCGDPNSTTDYCDGPGQAQRGIKLFTAWWKYLSIFIAIMLIILILALCVLPFSNNKADFSLDTIKTKRIIGEFSVINTKGSWSCNNKICEKVRHPSNNVEVFASLSRCTLLCTGPQLWPYPIGQTYFSQELVALEINKLEYKFNTLPSDLVHQYLGEAFKLFLVDLASLEKMELKSNKNLDLPLKKINIQIEVESDADPKLRLNTDESYILKIETISNHIQIKVSSVSFCGVRHGLETLTQLILLDQITGHLITLSNVEIRDAPSYKYRGIMIDTARNYIPVADLLRTLDGMAMCKLNTLHWRVSDATSFPLMLDSVPQLYQFGAYDSSMVYTKDDIRTIVARAGIRGVRVLIEVSVPGPVGRPWSWSHDAVCPNKDSRSLNNTCNILCLRLKTTDSIYNVLQKIYEEILNMTKVDDIFHLSDSVFSLINCYSLINDRDGFLEKVLQRLTLANKGFLPKLPIIWYTPHLTKEFEERAWERLGVQLHDWHQTMSDRHLSKYKVIHSSKWDLSCEMTKQRCKKYRTWQEMYNWNMWRNMKVFTIVGGEAVLWTDLVDSGNLEYHLWPRAAAVAERLWSDMVVNATVNRDVYVRLDSHRWHMQLRGIKVKPIWPLWCSFNPGPCLSKLS